MRTTFSTFLFLLLAVMANAQEAPQNDADSLFTPYFEIRQKEGTHELLKEYLMKGYSDIDYLLADRASIIEYEARTEGVAGH